MTAKPCSACRALCGNSGGFIMLRCLSFSSCLGEHVTVEKLPGRNQFLQLDVSIDKWRLVSVKRKRKVRIGIMENTKVKIRCIFPEGNSYLITVYLALVNKQKYLYANQHTQIYQDCFLLHLEGNIMPNPAQRIKDCASNVRLDCMPASLHLLLVFCAKNIF